jgi:peptidoglycan/xylan/chitin deacetylase (PgdA/CDA1 family)
VRTLRRFGVPATFFVVGYLAERYPDVVRLIRDGGFEIGNHSMHHPMDRPFGSMHPRQIREQIEWCDAVLTGMGIDASLFRPPGGSWSPEMVAIASETAERTVLWSVDSEDFRPQKPRLLAARVVRAAKPGSIILMHDGGGNRAATVRALPRIINGLRRKGLEIVPLG